MPNNLAAQAYASDNLSTYANEEVQHEIDTAYLDSIVDSRTSFDGILSMIFAENPPVTDSDAQAVAYTEKLQGQLEIVSSPTASTSAPISLPGSPDSNFDAKFPLSAEISRLGHTENEDPGIATTDQSKCIESI